MLSSYFCGLYGEGFRASLTCVRAVAARTLRRTAMTREIAKTCIPQRTGHAIRAAAIRLARERAGEEADPTVAYGCVDWFRYDVPPPQQATDQQPPAPARTHAGRDVAPPDKQ